MPTNYVSLIGMIEEWSDQSGELPAVVLTNFCDQDSYGRIPSGAIRRPNTGGWGDSGELGEIVGLMREGDYETVRRDCSETLQELVVSKVGILEFCKSANVKPPRSVVGWIRWLMWREHRHLSPPKYPATVEEHEEVERQQEEIRIGQEAVFSESLINGVEAQLVELVNRLRGAQKLEKLFPLPEWDFWVGDHIAAIKNAVCEISDQDVSDKFAQKLSVLEKECAAVRKPDDDEDDESISNSETVGYLTVRGNSKSRNIFQPGPKTSNKRKIFARVYEEWSKVPDHIKSLAKVRGRRDEAVDYLETRLPDVKRSSLARELTNVLKLFSAPNPE